MSRGCCGSASECPRAVCCSPSPCCPPPSCAPPPCIVCRPPCPPRCPPRPTRTACPAPLARRLHAKSAHRSVAAQATCADFQRERRMHILVTI
ncbi:uncharacterized protein LOC143362942 [Halictus rubicundus]|uniref:uncharacterized protein LOC143362942 n=1 Tax=Halictus rubicundus TaxID=77578 RepID=UPI004036AA17